MVNRMHAIRPREDGRERSEGGKSRSVLTEQVEWSAYRSGGPGGQSTNTTDSAVTGEWDLKKWFSGNTEEQARVETYFREKRPKHIKTGPKGEVILVAKSQQEKSQLQNKKTVVERLNELLKEALTVQEERELGRKPEDARREKARRVADAGRVKRLKDQARGGRYDD